MADKVIHTCEMCGVEHEIHPRAYRQRYCRECKPIREAELYGGWLATAREKRKGGKNRPKCSCGCGRPVGEGLRKLSYRCYITRTNDVEDEHRWL
jgi:hypothetical protein